MPFLKTFRVLPLEAATSRVDVEITDSGGSGSRGLEREAAYWAADDGSVAGSVVDFQ